MVTDRFHSAPFTIGSRFSFFPFFFFFSCPHAAPATRKNTENVITMLGLRTSDSNKSVREARKEGAKKGTGEGSHKRMV